MDDLEKRRAEIEEKIVGLIASSLENGSLDEDELSTVSNFVLERIDRIKNQKELIDFVSDLSQKWPVFKSIELIERGEIQEKVEDEATDDVSNLLKKGQIDEAIDLAGKVMER